jgi:hypothetical protein
LVVLVTAGGRRGKKIHKKFDGEGSGEGTRGSSNGDLWGGRRLGTGLLGTIRWPLEHLYFWEAKIEEKTSLLLQKLNLDKIHTQD